MDTLPHASLARYAKPLAALAGVGLIGCAVGMMLDHERTLYAYLTSYLFVLTTVLGMMFFVLLHHLVDAGWSTVVRRPAEQFLAALPLLAVMLVPVLIGMKAIYAWVGEAEHLGGKAAFLNVPFFVIRAAVYVAVWLMIGRLFRGRSLKQDETGDVSVNRTLRSRSAPAMLLYAVTLTFAAVDWVMTLDYQWYSTIIGVYVFSGGALAAVAVLTMLVLWLKRGPLADRVPEDRLHDLGKLVFMFAVFWAYIAFSQWFLIWYANMPEETGWMLSRWAGKWQFVSVLIVACEFALPFILLMAAAMKRSPRMLVPMCAIILFGHWLDCAWLVMPECRSDSVWLVWIDVSALLLCTGLVGSVIARAMSKASLVPIHDPRLSEAMGGEHD